MSSNIGDIYAVVDKSKKPKNRSRSPSQQEVTDVYAVVDKTKKIKSSVSEDKNYYDVNSDVINYNTVTNAASEDTTFCPTYSKLDEKEAPIKALQNTEALKQSDSEYCSGLSKNESFECPKEKKICAASPFLLLTGFIILAVGLAATLIASVVAFILIANLQSDITALSMELLSSSESTTTRNSLSYITKNFIELNSSIQLYASKMQQKISNLERNVVLRINRLENETNDFKTFENKLPQILREVQSNISQIQGTFSGAVIEYDINITTLVEDLTKEAANNVRNASAFALNVTNKFTAKIVQDIQAIYVFESCTIVRALSLSFSSGMYFVRSSNGGSVHVYCNNTILLTCNGVTGEWTRIAYLNTTGTTSPQCPSGLKARTNPSSCIRNVTSAGCSSVIFPVNVMYGCIYGRIFARQAGDPDGFTNSQGGERSSTSIEGNYVDGVSLTYGNPKQHIWTFTAASVHQYSNIMCDRCSSMSPAFVGNNYTCDTFRRCGDSGLDVCSNSLWLGGSCPPSNATFYRQLPRPTTDDIEMRVCRDQDQNDEDFLITLVELYIL